MTAQLQPGKLVTLRGREWVVLPSDDIDNLLIVKPLGGSDDEITGIYLPLDISSDHPVDACFLPPTKADLGDISTARLLYDSARLAFRNGAGPFRSLAKLSFRPRAYQIVPLIMALRQETVRLLVADDVGVGKTIEALLIVRELLERRIIRRFAVVCLPHLCEQWQEEIRSKLDIEAVIIRSNTQAGLDRRIQGDASVYDYYPFQIISIDFIKSDVRRDVFIEQCPELVIVDETHTCARPTGASAAQQQRYHLVSRIAAKPGQHLIMLTATPHSGKPEEFQSLLGLLKPDFELLDLPSASQAERRELARHFIQRKRADVEKWMDEDTHFSTRDTFEWSYDLSPEYSQFFGDILDFARKLVVPDPTGQRKRRVQYWTALALLRGVMSSPKAGVKMLNARIDRLADVGIDASVASAEEAENPVRDLDYGFEGDNAPTQVLELGDFSDYQRRQMKALADRLDSLGNIQQDGKLYAASIVLEEWLDRGFNPVVFCRYIDTAIYLGEHLGPALRRKFPKLDFQVVTSEDPDDVRRQRIDGMSGEKARILIAIRTGQVSRKTTLLLFRCRNVIEQSKSGHQIVAEEMLLWGWRGTPREHEYLDHAESKRLLSTVRASSNLSSEARASFLDNELNLMDSLTQQFDAIAEEQSKRLVAAHERFSSLMDKQRFQVVYPVLPMDLLGIYILLPEEAL